MCWESGDYEKRPCDAGLAFGAGGKNGGASSRAYKVGFKWDHLVRKIGFGRHCRAETAYKVKGEKIDLVRYEG